MPVDFEDLLEPATATHQGGSSGFEDLLEPNPSEKPELAPEGFWGTTFRELGSKIAPALGAAAGGLGAGALAIESGPGAIAADIAAGTAAGAGTEALQRKVMGQEWSDQNLAQMEANARAHPHAAMIGSALPFILSALGGGGGLVKQAGKKAAEGFTGDLAKEAAAKGAAKFAEESFLPSATGFARSSGASEAEKQVDTGKFDPASLAGETGMGFATGGLMHFIPAADLHNSETWKEFAKKALYQVTGKAVGDNTVMVLANKAYDHFVKGEPFTFSDVVGDVAAGSLDFALLNALHAGIAAKGFGKTMAERAKAQQDQEAKQAAAANARKVSEEIRKDSPKTADALEDQAIQTATAPPKEPEVKEEKGEEIPTPIPAPEIPPITPQGASVPIMVTRDMEQQLMDLGYSKAEVNAMRPAEAGQVIASGVTKKPITPVASEEPPPAAPETPPAASEGPSAVTTLQNPQDAPEAKETTKESKSGGIKKSESPLDSYLKTQPKGMVDQMNKNIDSSVASGEIGTFVTRGSELESAKKESNLKMSAYRALLNQRGLDIDLDDPIYAKDSGTLRYRIIPFETKKPITPTTTDLGPPGRTQTPPAESEGPSAVVTHEETLNASEALERAKEQVSGDLTSEERSQIEAMVRKRHAGKPPQVVDELVEDAVQATRRSALSQKYAPKLQEIAEQMKGISGPGKAPEPSTESGNFPPAPERADLAKRQPAPKEEILPESEPPRFEGASFKDKVARDHVTAAALAGEAAPMDRQGREGPNYGFKMEGQEEPISREEATTLTGKNQPTTGKKKEYHPQYRSGNEVKGRRPVLHSNELRLENQMSLTDVPAFRDEIPARRATKDSIEQRVDKALGIAKTPEKKFAPNQEKFETAYQSKDPKIGALHEYGETREEYLNRKICEG